MRMKSGFVIIILIILSIVGCGNFFPSALARFNPDDPDVQIKHFSAVSSGTESIITGWLWTDPSPDLDRSRIIDKIRIVHEREGIPDSPFPINSDNVKEVTDKSVWYYEWKGLKSDRNHYFVLYAHEKDGGWIQIPKILSHYLKPQGNPDSGSSFITVFTVDRDSDTNVVQSNGNNTSDIDASSNSIGFIRFDADYSVGVITSAEITSLGVSTADYMDIVPVLVRVETGMEWGDLKNPDYYDYSHAVHVKVDSSTSIVYITDIMNLARLYETNTIAFIASDTSSASYDLDSSNISYDFWRQY